MSERIKRIFAERLRKISAVDVQKRYKKTNPVHIHIFKENRLPHSLLESTTHRFIQSKLSHDS